MHPESTNDELPSPASSPGHLGDTLSDVARLAALAATGLPGSSAEPSFDRLSRLASRFLGVPVVLVSLVDAERQFFKSCVGLPEPWASGRETPLSHSFCQHVVASGEPLVIEDARNDPRVRGNLAIRDLNVIAYLGIPITIGGQVIGSFCAIDGKPRAWTPEDVATLSDLAQSVISEILLRAESSELKRSRQEAETARKNIEVTLASIGDAVIATDAQGFVTFCNPVASRLTAWPAEEAIGRPVAEIFTIFEALTDQAIEKFLDPVLERGQPVAWRDHTILVARDGNRREIEESAAPILIDQKISGAVITFRDTAKRRSQQRELEARERLFRTLADTIPQLAWMAEPNGHIFWYNTRWYDYTGTHLEEMQGWGWRSVHDPDVLPKVVERISHSFATGEPFEMTFPLRGADGIFRPFLTRMLPLRDESGAVSRWFGTNTDVSETARIEAELIDARKRLETAISAGSVGVFDWDMLHDRVAADRNVADFFGLTHEEQVAGTSDCYFSVIHPDDRKRVIMATEAKRHFNAEYRVTLPGRPLRWIVARGDIERDAETCQAVRMTGVMVDITDQKCLQDQLKDADRRKDEFLAMLAHELRNPLGAISSGVQLVQTVQKPELLAELRGMIQHQVKHLTHLIDDLLDVSRITQGKIELRQQTVELTAITRKAAELAGPQVDEKRHELSVSTPDTQILFVADPTRVEQMLSNLLTNAAKYSEPGRAIDLSAEVEGGEVVFRVRDQGFGITAEMLPKVFGLFTQVDATLDRARGGLGIGLTLVKNLAELHGGSVAAASEGEHKGSEFTLRLPIGQPEALQPQAAAPPPPPVARPSPARHRILIIDDNRDTARMTSRLLAHQGYEMMTAHDGYEGIEAAKAFAPHAILLDIGLPGMNGYEVAAALRHHECCRDSIIIAVSGYGETAARERSKEVGIDHHLTKPVDFDELGEILQTPDRREPAVT